MVMGLLPCYSCCLELPAFLQVQEREVVLVNTGKVGRRIDAAAFPRPTFSWEVAFHFNWNLCALSRPPVLDCWPVSGQINPGEKAGNLKQRSLKRKDSSALDTRSASRFDSARVVVSGSAALDDVRGHPPLSVG